METVTTSGNFTFKEVGIEGLLVVEPKVFADARGNFHEPYRKSDFAAAGIVEDFVQDNQALSVRGVMRGMHFQMAHPQAKVVRVAQGEVFDAVIDIRPDSPSFGKWYGTVLSDENCRQLYMARGFAHGYLVLSEQAVFCYKCDDYYYGDDQWGIVWDDATVGVEWPPLPEGCEILLSQKDLQNPSFSEWAEGACRK